MERQDSGHSTDSAASDSGFSDTGSLSPLPSPSDRDTYRAEESRTVAERTDADLPYIRDLVTYAYNCPSLLPVLTTRTRPESVDHEPLAWRGGFQRARGLRLHGQVVQPASPLGSHMLNLILQSVRTQPRVARLVTDVFLPADPWFEEEQSQCYALVSDLLKAMQEPLLALCDREIDVHVSEQARVYDPSSRASVKGYCHFHFDQDEPRPSRFEVRLSLSEHSNWFDVTHTLLHELAHALAPEDTDGHGAVWLRRFALLCAWARHTTRHVTLLDTRPHYRGWRQRLLPILNVSPSARDEGVADMSDADSPLDLSPAYRQVDSSSADCAVCRPPSRRSRLMQQQQKHWNTSTNYLQETQGHIHVPTDYLQETHRHVYVPTDSLQDKQRYVLTDYLQETQEHEPTDYLQQVHVQVPAEHLLLNHTCTCTKRGIQLQHVLRQGAIETHHSDEQFEQLSAGLYAFHF